MIRSRLRVCISLPAIRRDETKQNKSKPSDEVVLQVEDLDSHGSDG